MQQKNCSHIFIFFILTFLIVSCREMWGNHSLGNNFSLLEGDKVEDRVIVYCYRGNEVDCKGGTYTVPTYQRHFDKNRYAEYVKEAKSNNDWIIAKTFQIQNKRENYWIINKGFDMRDFNCDKMNCDSMIQSHITGPLNFLDFQKKIKELNLTMSLK